MSKAAELANLIGNINAGGGGANKNVIINSAMNVAQRGTSTSGVGANATVFPACDRWALYSNDTAGRLTISQDSSVPTGKGFANSLKFDCTTADTSVGVGEQIIFFQRIEGQNLQGFAKGTSEAKPFAVSFYVKGNASATYICELIDPDNSYRHVNKAFNVTTDWTRVEITFPPDTTGTFDDDNNNSLEFGIHLHNGSNFTGGTLQETWGSLVQGNRGVGGSSIVDSTDRTFFITGVQLEVGQNPTSFEVEPFERTLAKCQRYYWQGALAGGGCYGGGGSIPLIGFTYPKPMRASPSASYVSGGTASNGGADYTITGLYNPALVRQTNLSSRILFTQTGTTGSNTQGCDVSGAIIQLNAEL